MQDEEQLAGGNVGQTTRRGDRVFRTAGPWTPGVQRLMAHLRASGLDWVPEPLGLDDRGREVVAFIPGDVPGYPMPDWVWAEATLTDAARMLRQMHDATAGYDDPDATWRQPEREPAEVICHNDFAPYNMVFENGHIIGVIDFDMASPGSRLWDLAYLAYRLVPLTAATNPDDGPFDEATRRSRLDALTEAYGTPFPIVDLLRMTQDRLRHLAQFSDDLADETGRADLHEHAALYRGDVVYLEGLIGRLNDQSGLE
jgi:hypothetical protein